MGCDGSVKGEEGVGSNLGQVARSCTRDVTLNLRVSYMQNVFIQTEAKKKRERLGLRSVL
jgi:hypothetical protein